MMLLMFPLHQPKMWQKCHIHVRAPLKSTQTLNYKGDDSTTFHTCQLSGQFGIQLNLPMEPHFFLLQKLQEITILLFYFSFRIKQKK